MQLNNHERELLRELADTGLLEKVTESAELKMFAKFKKETEPEQRVRLGLVLDAMSALAAEARIALNEGILDGKRTSTAA